MAGGGGGDGGGGGEGLLHASAFHPRLFLDFARHWKPLAFGASLPKAAAAGEGPNPNPPNPRNKFLLVYWHDLRVDILLHTCEQHKALDPIAEYIPPNAGAWAVPSMVLQVAQLLQATSA